MNGYTPQDFLNMLHGINIPGLYESTLSDAEASTLVKQKLQEVRSLLKNAINAIEARWDGRDALQKGQEAIELEPYRVIETLVIRLETRNVELQTSGAREPLPFGRIIYGSTGDWHIGEERQAKIWTLKQERQASLLKIRSEQNTILEGEQANIDAIKRNMEQLKTTYETRVAQEINHAKAHLAQLETALNEAQTTFELNHDSWKYTSIILIGILLITGVLLWAANAVVGRFAEPPASTLIFAGVLIAILFIGTIFVFAFVMAERDSRLQSRKAQADILRLNSEKESIKPNLEKLLVRIRQNYEEAMAQLNQELEESITHQELTRRLAESQFQAIEESFESQIKALEKEA